MPKVKINNSQGLTQVTGGGFAPYGAMQSITAHTTAANAKIHTTTSVVLGKSGNASHKILLPEGAGLAVGHTIVVGNIDSTTTHTFQLHKHAADRINGVNGKLDVKNGSAAFCVYGGNTVGTSWCVTLGDAATIPS